MTAIDRRGRAAAWMRRGTAAFEPPPAWVADALVRATLRRILVVSLAAVPVHVILLLLFWSLDPATTDEQRWRTGIMAAHGVLLVLQVLVAGYVARVRHRDVVTTSMRAARFVALAILLGAGIVLTTIDQLVTPSVTPLVLTGVIAGLVIMLPPRLALAGYLVGYLAFVVAVGVTQSDPSILASNRANGLTAIVIGVALTVVMWRAESRNLLQGERIQRQQELLEASNRELATLASYDALTGLANRRALQLMLDNEAAQMRREGHTSSLVLFDVDHFKQINDEHGHPVGDEVLRQLAQVLSQRLRGSDLIARWGGEEFLVLLPRTDLDGARILAEEVRNGIEQRPFDAGEVVLRLTVSAGTTALDLAHDDPVVTAYRAVDAALYRAKERGRNRVVAADGACHDDVDVEAVTADADV